jgi:putative effector of murein hydrolase
VESIMAAFNVRTFLKHRCFERRRRAAVCYAISATAVIAVLCAVREMSENSCEGVVLGTAMHSTGTSRYKPERSTRMARSC